MRNLSIASIVRFSIYGIAPGASIILFWSSIPFFCRATSEDPERCPLISSPQTIRYLMWGFDITLATIFSMPIFSVLSGPYMATVLGGVYSVLRITTATRPSGEHAVNSPPHG